MIAVETSMRAQHPVHYKTVRVNNQDIFYREAGPQDAPVILLLHGFPTSSNMFRNLIPRLAGSFRLIAPDYPGYGQSSMPDHKSFEYTFENLANIVDGFVESLGLTKYSMYVMDYGAPIGYRLALLHPERIQGLIVQNGNAYEEGLLEFWDPIKKYWADPTPKTEPRCTSWSIAKSTRWQYETGVPDTSLLGPDHVAGGSGWPRSARKSRYPDGPDAFLRNECAALPGVPGLLPQVSAADADRLGQERLHLPRRRRPPYARDLKNVETHMLDTGHFALETHGEEIASRIEEFLLEQNIKRSSSNVEPDSRPPISCGGRHLYRAGDAGPHPLGANNVAAYGRWPRSRGQGPGSPSSPLQRDVAVLGRS